MNHFNTREKLLSIVIVVLLFTVVYFSYHLYSYGFFYNVQIQEMPSDFKPPTLEEAIKSSKVIFTCTNEDEDKYIRFKIDRILYKRDDYQFPFNLGEIYGDLSEKKQPNVYYGDGRLVLLCDGSMTMRLFTIRNDEIRTYNGVDSSKVISIKEVTELIKLLKNS